MRIIGKAKTKTEEGKKLGCMWIVGKNEKKGRKRELEMPGCGPQGAFCTGLLHINSTDSIGWEKKVEGNAEGGVTGI